MSEQQDWMDMREVLHRVRGTWASQELMISELLGSARPPGGRSAKPWRDARVYAAIDACVSSGMLTMQSALCGTVLRLTERGREVLDYEPPRSRERDAAVAECGRLREALQPFVTAYERAGRKDLWAGAYLNNNAWGKAHAALAGATDEQ